MKLPVKTLSTIVIVISCAAITFWLYANKPKTKRSRPKKPVPIVSVMEASLSDQPVSIEAFGTVIPARKTTLSSQVEGRLTSISQELVPGGIVSVIVPLGDGTSTLAPRIASDNVMGTRTSRSLPTR